MIKAVGRLKYMLYHTTGRRTVSANLRNSRRHEDNRDLRDEETVAQDVEGPLIDLFIGCQVDQGASDEQGPDAEPGATA